MMKSVMGAIIVGRVELRTPIRLGSLRRRKLCRCKPLGFQAQNKMRHVDERLLWLADVPGCLAGVDGLEGVAVGDI